MFVCGSELAFKGQEKYAVDFFGTYDTVEEAVLKRKELHTSFSYSIYEVTPEVTHGLKRAFGMVAGNQRSGHRIIRKVCNAYDHPAWQHESSESPSM